eukprot:7044919-Pyramimonas_sp.AAC.1
MLREPGGTLKEPGGTLRDPESRVSSAMLQNPGEPWGIPRSPEGPPTGPARTRGVPQDHLCVLDWLLAGP